MTKSSKSIHAVSRQALLLILTAAGSQSALACDGDMGEYIGSLCTTSATYCPQNYVEAKGQVLPINTNQPLFAVIGFLYGGDGKTTFALPDLQGRTPVSINPTTQPGLSIVQLAQKRGSATTTLGATNLPLHNHAAAYNPTAVTNSLTIDIPVSANNPTTVVTPTATVNRLAASPTTGQTEATIWSATMTQVATVGGATVSATGNTATVNVVSNGSGQAYANLAPELGLRYCIATVGIFPSRP